MGPHFHDERVDGLVNVEGIELGIGGDLLKDCKREGEKKEGSGVGREERGEREFVREM